MTDPQPAVISPPPDAALRSGRWRWAVPAFLHPVIRLLAPYHWLADLFSHFTIPALVLTLITLFAFRRQRRLAVVLGLLALVQAWPIARLYGPNPVTPDQHRSERLRMLVANIYVDNVDHDPLIQLIRSESPEVIGLIEFTGAWQEALAAIAADYPYRAEFPNGSQGLALWSKRPIRVSGPMTFHPLGWPVLRGEIEFDGRPLDLWLVHPTSPTRRLGTQEGFAELLAIGDQVGAQDRPRVVMGDLNTTDSSPFFQDFLRRSGTRDGRLGFGIQPSWPSNGYLAIPIDHVLPSPELAVTERRLGPRIGSDHRPVLVELAPAASARNAASTGAH